MNIPKLKPFNIDRTTSSLTFGIALILLAGCVSTPNRSYWVTREGTLQPYQVSQDFSKNLRIIEFDDQGDFWSKSQVDDAEKFISSRKKRPLVLVYVHGWHHNANPGDGDLKKFNDFVNKLSQSKTVTSEFDVCGIYIGWRGLAYERCPYNPVSWAGRYLSFWDRKAATDRMAGVPLTHLFAELKSLTTKRDGVLTIIGHSFGARIVERSIGNSIIALSSTGNGDSLPADLVLLINPASESLYARELKLALTGWKLPRPFLISLTSQNDSATDGIWHLGTSLFAGLGKFRDYDLKVGPEDQRSYLTQTAGHDRRQITHNVEAVNSSPMCPVEGPFEFNLAKSSSNCFYIKRDEKTGGACETFRLIPQNPDRVAGPKIKHNIPSRAYWVISVNKDILFGHSGDTMTEGIFADPTMDFCAALFKIVTIDNLQKPAGSPVAPVSSIATTGNQTTDTPKANLPSTGKAISEARSAMGKAP